MRWILTKPDNVEPDQREHLDRILARSPHLAAAARHVAAFADMMTNLTGHRLPEWIAAVTADELPALHSFVTGVQRDMAAVTNGLTLPHSSGPVEGRINRIKCSSGPCSAALTSTCCASGSWPPPERRPSISKSVPEPQFEASVDTRTVPPWPGCPVGDLTAPIRAACRWWLGENGPMISRDELLERAVRNARPESKRWAHMVAKMRADPSVETFRWVSLRLADPRVLARRFAVDVLFSLAFEQRAWRAEAVAAIRPRLAVETDTQTLGLLLASLAEYSGFGPLPEVRAYAGHPDPDIRAWVGTLLDYALPEPESVAVLLALTADPHPSARGTALRTLAWSELDSEPLQTVFTARFDDEDPNVRWHALTGLALRGDDAAMGRIWQLVRENPAEDGYYWSADQVERERNRRTSRAGG